MSPAVAAAVLYAAPPLVGLALARLLAPAPRPALGRVDVLVPAGLVVQFGAAWYDGALQAGYVILGIWVALRLLRAPTLRERAAFAAIAVGGALNAIAIFANGRMPHTATGGDSGLKGVPIDDDTRVAWLGDVIPFLGKLISAGDLVLLVGVALLIAAALAARPAQQRTPEPRAERAHAHTG